jgi:hypothetical protein
LGAIYREAQLRDVPRTILVLIAWWFVVGGLLVLAGCAPHQPPLTAEQQQLQA